MQVACPHCHTELLLPDNCGGQTTRCPSCVQNFIIPGNGAAATDSSVGKVPTSAVAPAEPQWTEADLKRAQQWFDELTAENVGLQVELAKRAGRRNRLATQTKWLKRFQAGRQRLDHSTSRVGGFFIVIALAPAVAMVLFSVFGLSAFGYFVVAALAMIAAGAAFLPFSYYPDDVQLGLLIPRYEDRLAEVTTEHDMLAEAETAHREKLEEAEADLQRIRSAVSSRLAWLRSAQWQQMNAKPLVKFLEQVFQEHGYQVEHTGKKGQAGIDLVVARDGVRTAVQVKGIQVHTVDNQVVQQTHAACDRFRCQRAAVITNAQFLPSARQVAQRLGVRLIDAGEMPELVEGRITV